MSKCTKGSVEPSRFVGSVCDFFFLTMVLFICDFWNGVAIHDN